MRTLFLLLNNVDIYFIILYVFIYLICFFILFVSIDEKYKSKKECKKVKEPSSKAMLKRVGEEFVCQKYE